MNIIDCAYRNLDGRAYYTPRLHGLAYCSWATGHTACFWTKQHEVKSSTGQKEAIKRGRKHEMYEAAAGIRRHTVFQQTFFFLIRERVHSKIIMKSIGNTSTHNTVMIIVKHYVLHKIKPL